jgi:hypothetical protein
MAYLYEACDQNIRFLPSIVAEKNATKNILGRMDRSKTVYTPSGGAGDTPPPVERGIFFFLVLVNCTTVEDFQDK